MPQSKKKYRDTGLKSHFRLNNFKQIDQTNKSFLEMISNDSQQGLTQLQCIYRMNSTFGKEAKSKATIYCWSQKFRFSRGSLIGKFYEGH